MSSTSPAQEHMMAGIAHGWRPDRIKGPPVEVAREFNRADKRRRAERRARALEGSKP